MLFGLLILWFTWGMMGDDELYKWIKLRMMSARIRTKRRPLIEF